MKIFEIVILLSLCLLVSCQSADLKKYSFSSRQMGVDFRIDLYAEHEKKAASAVKKAFARVASINQIMSDYIVDSELWKLSESSGSKKRFKVSQELWDVLAFSKEMHNRTAGAFDITAGPYFLLWRKARVIKRIPAERSMARAANKVGMDKMLMFKEHREVELTAENMRLDLGGVAKGYAADEALKVLRREGISCAMVDGSGDIAVTEPYGDSWKIYISGDVKDVSEYINVREGAVATSGDTYQFVEIEGKRYSHIVNPKTGLGITNRCRVTIYAKDCKTADAWASAVSVLGPKKGLQIIESVDGVEALVLQKQGENHRYFKSSGFPEIFKKR